MTRLRRGVSERAVSSSNWRNAISPLWAKNIGDGFAGMLLDPVIGIDEIEAQMIGGKAPNGRFSRAHEPDEGEVVNGALVLVRHGCI